MIRRFQRDQGAQALRLFVSNEPVPDSICFEFRKGGERTEINLSLPQTCFGLRGREERASYDRYERASGFVDGSAEERSRFEKFLSDLMDAADVDRPLWIELARPKGALALVPWERFIASRIPLKLLRWPYHLLNPEPQPAENSGGIEIVICASVPRAKAPFPALDLIKGYVEGVMGDDGDHRFHIFVDFDVDQDRGDDWSDGEVGTYDQLQEQLAPGIAQGRVILYDPRKAESYGAAQRERRVTSDDRISNPWLQWMMDNLQAPSVDLVHFFCHGYLARGRGSLAFAESPIINRDRGWARFAGGPQVANFLDQIGAWSVGFTSPEQNYSEAATWALADEIAEMRPGPVLVHDLREDPGMYLVDMFRFLYRREVDALPRTDALTLFAHPDLLKARADASAERPEYVELLESLGVTGNTPGFLTKAQSGEVKAMRSRGKAPDQLQTQAELRWVAASQRFLEQKASQVAGSEAILQELAERGEKASEVRISSLSGKKKALSFVADLLNTKLKSTLGE